MENDAGGRTSTESELEPVDLLVTGIDWLVTVDPQRRVLRNAAVAIRNGRFVAVGLNEEVSRSVRPRKTIDGSGTVGTPGFIDGHLHSSFHLSRGLADEVRAPAFLFERMYPYEGAMTEEDVYDSARFAAWELLRHGVTCFVDPGNYHPEATVRACQEVGIRVFTARSTFDEAASVLGILPEQMIDTTANAVAATRGTLDDFGGPIERGYSASASFRSLSNSSDGLITGLKELASEYGTFLQCHAAFDYSTRDASLSKRGLTEIGRLEALGVLDEWMLVVHAGWLEPEDLTTIVRRNPRLVSSPSSSLHNGYGYLEVGFVPELLAFGVTVALASDHASSGAVDMCREMYLASCAFKETRVNPRLMPPETVLEMATLHGARAVHAEADLGSVEVGKLADLVLFDAGKPEWLPLYNPVSNLVYSAHGATVRSVLVGGEIALDGGSLQRVDESDVIAAVASAGERILARLDGGSIISLRWPVIGHTE